jgi:N-acetylglucosamine-6-sulfatase
MHPTLRYPWLVRTRVAGGRRNEWLGARRGLALIPGLAAVVVASGATAAASAAAATAPEVPAAPAQASSEARRPNVVMVMLDDLNPHDGRLFAPEIMPNLSELIISQGIRFTDFHAEVPLCGPSRANLLTGQHAHNSGANSNDGAQLDPSTTIATELDEAGYRTSYVGKYLNGYRAFPPERRDPPGWDSFDVIDSNQGKYFWYEMRDRQGGITQHRTDEADYSTDVIADLAVQRLREAPADEPVFTLISPFTPHEPNLPAPRHEGDPRCADLPRWAPPNYDEADVSDKPPYIADAPPLGDAGFDLIAHCESLLAVDDLIGQVGDELQRQGRLEDTLFIFTADNGMTWGEHRRVGKVSPYSSAVPTYAAWPARRGVEPRDDDTTLSMIDWAPTICELAGCQMGPYPNGQEGPDGLSFAAVLADQPFPYERPSILHTMPSGGDRPVYWSLRTTADHPSGRWLYVENLDGFRELYDVSGGPCTEWQPGDAGDPCLLQNRLAGEPDTDTLALADRLSKELAALKVEVAPKPVPSPEG